MARTSRKTQVPLTPPANVTDIDDAFSRVMARACQAAADKVQDDALNQLSVEWERGNQAQFHETQRASRDDFGLVGEVHLKPIPEGRWQVFYNRATATYRLEAITPNPEPKLAPARELQPKLVAASKTEIKPKPAPKIQPKPVADPKTVTKTESETQPQSSPAAARKRTSTKQPANS